MELLKVKEAKGKYIKNAEDVLELMVDVCEADRECMWVLHMNTKLRLIERELVSMGSLDYAIVHPREVFRKAISLSSASIFTVHNHPSGDTTPSSDDQRMWKRLNETGEIIGINVLDHLIISPNGNYYSYQKSKEG